MSVTIPFRYTRFIDRPDEAIARPRELDRVMMHVSRGEYVSVLAPRQTGKTTFLHELRRRLPECIYVDLEGTQYSDVSEVVASLARSAGEERLAESGSLAGFLTRLDRPPGCIFLIDELSSARSLAVSFLRSVRAYYSENDRRAPVFHRFVIAGSHDLADLTLDDDPDVSVFNIASVVYLEDFGKAEIAEFVGRRAEGALSSEVIERVFEYTQGHPFLTQFLCDYLYHKPRDGVEKQLADPARLLDECGVEASVNIQSMVSHLFESRSEPESVLPALEKILAGRSVTFSKSSRIIRRLYLQHGCIRDAQGSCVVRNPIYEAVLKKNVEIRSEVSFPRATSGTPSEMVEDAMRRVESLLAGPTLVNYSGYLHVSVATGEGALPLRKANVVRVEPGQELKLCVKLTPDRDGGADTVAEEMRVVGGVHAEEVTFEVIPDSEAVQFTPPRSLVRMRVRGTSDRLEFQLSVLARQRRQHALWIQVFQQNRLVHSLRIDIDTRRQRR